MGKQRRKFETGFKQQIVQEVESGLLSVSAASRKYQISGSVIDRWRRQARTEDFRQAPRFERSSWSGKTASSRRSWPSFTWRTIT
jgi:transposase-like protein